MNNVKLEKNVNDALDEQFVTIKTVTEIEKMRAAGRLAAESLRHTCAAIAPGVTTLQLDRIAHDFIRAHGAVPSSLGYRGFPRSICTSINDVVCHGIPSKDAILREGDIINVDIAVYLDGYHGDTSMTMPVGRVSDTAERLLRTTLGSLMNAISHVKPGLRTRDIGGLIEDVIVPEGFSSVRDFVGHGVGRGYHEPPMIFHYRNKEEAVRLRPGMVFTIEPMINVGKPDVYIESDGWTARTRDGSLSAQFEHTILVTETGYEILTL